LVHVKYFIGLLIFFFIFRYVYLSISENDLSSIKFNFYMLFFSIILIATGILFQHYLWYLITFYFGVRITTFKSIKIRSYSELGKYIPGRVVLYGILFTSYKKFKISQKKIAFCSIIESVSSLTSAIIVALVALFLVNFEVELNVKLFSIIFLIFCLIIIYPGILQYLLNIIFKLFKKEIIEINISYLKILFIVFLNTFTWLIFGLSFYFLINSFTLISFSNYWYLTGTFAISSFLGFIAIFVPAGLGIREGSLILLLGKIIIEPFSGMASILSRLLIIIGDVIIILVFYLTDRIFLRYYSPKSNN